MKMPALLAVAALLSLTPISLAMAEEQWNCRAVFDCTWVLATRCGYTIFYKTGGMKNFIVPKGQTAIIDQLNPLDRYCFATDTNGMDPRPRDGCPRIPVATLGDTRFVCK
jgi:hypothetical protein